MSLRTVFSGKWLRSWVLDDYKQAPHVRQANPVGGCPPQFTQRIVSCHEETPKMSASRLTSSAVISAVGHRDGLRPHTRCR
jgi:hypothetical protein